MTIQLGCMNRPWGKFTFDDALGGIVAAGFANFGLLLMHQDAVVTGDTTPAQAAEVSARVRAHGLSVRMIPSNVPLDKGHDVAIRYVRTMIGHASALDVRILLEMGSSHPERYDDYFAVMRAAAPIAADHGVTIALKPHGGLSTTSDDCLHAIERVDHPAYRLCFDPGNLLYYAGERPEPALTKLIKYVVATCLKDETGGSGPNRAVDVTAGDGDVDFPTIIGTLKAHGFAGPAIVETLGLGTLEAVNANALRAHGYLAGLIAG